MNTAPYICIHRFSKQLEYQLPGHGIACLNDLRHDGIYN